MSAGEGTAWEWTVANGLRSVYVIRWISYYYDDHCAVDDAENWIFNKVYDTDRLRNA